MFVFAANPLQPLIEFFEAILKFFHDTGGLGWGAAIIALTLCVRLVLLPLTLKQFKSMQSMARLQPEIKKLQESHKGDKERLNQEMMKFYRENRINPFASCLPLLAQLPVFLSLFYMLQDDLRVDICGQSEKPCGELGAPDTGFLFIPDLTDNATGVVLVTLILLYIGSQLASTLLMSTATDKTQRTIFLALPFVFVIFIISFPAGLLVYWITTNLWTIVQQAIVRRRLGPLRPPGQEQESLSDMIGKLTGRHEEEADGKIGKRDGARPAGAHAKAQTSSAPAKAAVAGNEPKGRPSGPPPAPPRRKKKRSGRRR